MATAMDLSNGGAAVKPPAVQTAPVVARPNDAVAPAITPPATADGAAAAARSRPQRQQRRPGHLANSELDGDPSGTPPANGESLSQGDDDDDGGRGRPAKRVNRGKGGIRPQSRGPVPAMGGVEGGSGPSPVPIALSLNNVRPAAPPAVSAPPQQHPGGPAPAPMIREPREKTTELFCLCRQPYDSRRLMIGCDKCNGWFHPKCVGMSTSESRAMQGKNMSEFICPPCRKLHGIVSPPAVSPAAASASSFGAAAAASNLSPIATPQSVSTAAHSNSIPIPAPIPPPSVPLSVPMPSVIPLPALPALALTGAPLHALNLPSIAAAAASAISALPVAMPSAIPMPVVPVPGWPLQLPVAAGMLPSHAAMFSGLPSPPSAKKLAMSKRAPQKAESKDSREKDTQLGKRKRDLIEKKEARAQERAERLAERQERNEANQAREIRELTANATLFGLPQRPTTDFIPAPAPPSRSQNAPVHRSQYNKPPVGRKPKPARARRAAPIGRPGSPAEGDILVTFALDDDDEKSESGEESDVFMTSDDDDETAAGAPMDDDEREEKPPRETPEDGSSREDLRLSAKLRLAEKEVEEHARRDLLPFIAQEDYDKMTPVDLDRFLLTHYQARKAEVECKLLKLEARKRLYAAGLAYATRVTLRSLNNDSAKLIDPAKSTLLAGMHKTNEDVTRIWLDMIVCPSCETHVPSTFYSKHTIDCAATSALARKEYRIATGFRSPAPTSVVCGSPLEDQAHVQAQAQGQAQAATAAGYCTLLREQCDKHLMWQSLWKAEIAQEGYVQSRRLELLNKEIETVVARMADREQQIAMMKEPADAKDAGVPQAPAEPLLQLLAPDSAMSSVHAQERLSQPYPPPLAPQNGQPNGPAANAPPNVPMQLDFGAGGPGARGVLNNGMGMGGMMGSDIDMNYLNSAVAAAAAQAASSAMPPDVMSQMGMLNSSEMQLQQLLQLAALPPPLQGQVSQQLGFDPSQLMAMIQQTALQSQQQQQQLMQLQRPSQQPLMHSQSQQPQQHGQQQGQQQQNQPPSQQQQLQLQQLAHQNQPAQQQGGQQQQRRTPLPLNTQQQQQPQPMQQDHQQSSGRPPSQTPEHQQQQQQAQAQLMQQLGLADLQSMMNTQQLLAQVQAQAQAQAQQQQQQQQQQLPMGLSVQQLQSLMQQLGPQAAQQLGMPGLMMMMGMPPPNPPHQ